MPGAAMGPEAIIAARVTGRICHIAGICLRIFAIFLAVLVVGDALVTDTFRLTLMNVTQSVAGVLPKELAGLFVYQTPFGGVLRGDFVIASVLSFVIDWLLQKVWYVAR